MEDMRSRGTLVRSRWPLTSTIIIICRRMPRRILMRQKLTSCRRTKLNLRMLFRKIHHRKHHRLPHHLLWLKALLHQALRSRDSVHSKPPSVSLNIPVSPQHGVFKWHNRILIALIGVMHALELFIISCSHPSRDLNPVSLHY